MSAKNPELRNINRPGYELPGLLQQLAGVSYFTPLTPEQTHLAEAARTHAHNQRETIVSGMDSLGQLVYLAGDNDAGLDPHHLRNIGLLISDLAVQLESLTDVSESMENYLNPGRLGDSAAKGAKK